MSVVQPWMLLFGLVALAPLILHLIGRQRARVVPFSALRFLLARDPKRARALRLEQRALVATRMALAALVALVLAQPLLPDWSADDALSLGREPVAVVVVLDDSLSMATRTPGDAAAGDPSPAAGESRPNAGGSAASSAPRPALGPSRLAVARERVRSLLQALPPGSRAAVVLSGRPARALRPQLSPDLRSLATDVTRVAPSARPDDAARALQVARRLLAGAAPSARRLVVVSDLQESGWADAAEALRAPHTRTIRVGAPIDDVVLRDVAIEATAAAALPPGVARVGAQQVGVRVVLERRSPGHPVGVSSPNSDVPWRGVLRLRIGGREVRQRVTLAPGQRLSRVVVVPAIADHVEVSVMAASAGGGRDVAQGPAGETEIQPSWGDAQPRNNVRWLRLGAGQTLRVAVVNGAPRAVARRDEVFFLVRALQAGVERSDELRVDVLRPEQLVADAKPGQVAAGWDVLVLANVAELSAAQVAAIRRRVKGGAGVLITLGDQTVGSDATWLSALFPGKIGGVNASRPHRLMAVAAAEAGAARVRPRLAALRKRLAEVVLPAAADARVRRRQLVRPDARVAGWVALRYDDGAPALLVAPRGRGRVVLWTTSVDRDWMDLPLQPAWLPLARALIWASAGREPGAERLDVEVAQPVTLPRKRDATALELRYGGEVVRTLAAAGQPAGRWRINGLPRSGRWQLRETAPSGERVRWALVRSPAAEAGVKLLPAPAPMGGAASSSGSRRAPLVPVAPFGVLGLLVLLIVEAIILRRQAGPAPYPQRAGAPSPARPARGER